MRKAAKTARHHEVLRARQRFSFLSALLVISALAVTYMVYRGSYAAEGDPYACSHPRIERGQNPSEGCVKHAKRLLTDIKIYNFGTPGPTWGDDLTAAVQKFKGYAGLGSNGNVIDDPAWAKLHEAVANPPRINSFTINGQSGATVVRGSKVSLVWNSSNTLRCSVTGQWNSGNVDPISSASPTANSSGNYVLNCYSRFNPDGWAAPARSVSVTVTDPPTTQPPPPQPQPSQPKPPSGGSTPPPAGSTPGGSSSKPPRTGTAPVQRPGTAAQPSAAPDTTPPSVPGSLAVELDPVDSVATLTWVASDDASGIKHYLVERSKDNKTWETLGEESGNEFQDKDAAFNAHYYYRVKAVDNAGNSSDYAVAETNTGEFSANAGEGEASITSEDGMVEVIIVEGALSEDAVCSIKLEEEAKDLPEKLKVVVGPYTLTCKAEDGEEITDFNAALSMIVTVPDDRQKKFKDIGLYKFNEEVWGKMEDAQWDKESDKFVTPLFNSGSVVVLGAAKKGISPSLLAIIFLMLAGIAGAFVFFLRRAQKQNYNDYLRRKYYNL